MRGAAVQVPGVGIGIGIVSPGSQEMEDIDIAATILREVGWLQQRGRKFPRDGMHGKKSSSFTKRVRNHCAHRAVGH